MNKTVRNLTVLGIGFGISSIVGWFFLRESREAEPDSFIVKTQYGPSSTPPVSANIVLPLDAHLPTATDSESVEQPEAAPGMPDDDLTQIKDIGPRFAAALRDIGITRFDQLAGENPESLAIRLSEHVTVRPQRIQDNNWIGQAADLAKSGND